MAKYKVDFSGVSDSGSITPGNHPVKVAAITKEAGKDYPYLKWDLVITSGPCKGLHINHITSLDPKALFNLRNTLISLGLNVPKSALTFDTDALVGRAMGIEVFLKKSEDGTKEFSNVKKTFPLNGGAAPSPTTIDEPVETIGNATTGMEEVIMDLDGDNPF